MLLLYLDYYLRNAQGDIVKIIDSAGGLAAQYTYDTWGKVLSATDVDGSGIANLNPFRYRGYVYDTETGWYYLQSRYYDPELGRFISSDVYLSTGQGIIGHNAYAYCLNNPVNLQDGSGCRPTYATFMSDGPSAAKNPVPRKEHVHKKSKKYNVPFFHQSIRENICWAYCIAMTMSKYSPDTTQEKGAALARKIAESVYGEDNWNNGLSYMRLGTCFTPHSINDIYDAISNTPIFAFYNFTDGLGNIGGHVILIIGVDLNKNILYVNDPNEIETVEYTFNKLIEPGGTKFVCCIIPPNSTALWR